MSPCFLIFGFGYTAEVLAQSLVSLGFSVIGTKRELNIEDSNCSPTIKLINFNCHNMEDYLNQATHLLICIPPISTIGDLVLTKYHDLIKKHAPHLQWIGYLSSTGVYGDHQGRWVDEKTKCIPHTPTGITRLEVEKAWFSYAKINRLPLHIFRLSGIYGKGRNALERIYLGKKYSIFKEGQIFCRIHVEDIASVLIASISSINPLSIYNLSDDEPEASHIVDGFAASLLKRKPPLLVSVQEAQLSSMEQEFYTNNRRVSNLKIKRELNISLQYPSFREGLTQIWREDFASKRLK
ncbi:SDR family oxidoreductase [Legionella nagasakiensis]|uniref:SDR family oxidoreductase n=1 Tax=Legionella nagasakiensis TaxID=535290 RepID=UPI0010548594|nr:SDR family oxidoreductase [Legionella nagasakiensis]